MNEIISAINRGLEIFIAGTFIAIIAYLLVQSVKRTKKGE